MNAKIIYGVVGLALGAGMMIAFNGLSGDEVRLSSSPRVAQQDDLAEALSELTGEIARLRSSIERTPLSHRAEGVAEVPGTVPSGSTPVSSHEAPSAAEGSLEFLTSMKEKEALATLLARAKTEATLALERAKRGAQSVDRSGIPAPGAEGARQSVELWTKCLQEMGDVRSIEDFAAIVAKYHLETSIR